MRSFLCSVLESENEVGFGLAILRDHSKSIVLRQIEKHVMPLGLLFSDEHMNISGPPPSALGTAVIASDRNDDDSGSYILENL